MLANNCTNDEEVLEEYSDYEDPKDVFIDDDDDLEGHDKELMAFDL